MNRLTSDRSQLAQFLFRGVEACYCMVPFIDKKVGKGVGGQPCWILRKEYNLKQMKCGFLLYLEFFFLKGVKGHCGAGCLDLTSAKSDRSMTAVRRVDGLCKAYAR